MIIQPSAPAIILPPSMIFPEKHAFRGGTFGAVSSSRVGESVFSPLDIPDLELWLDPSDTSAGNIAHTAGSVTTWYDKSGNGNNATQGTAAQQFITGTQTINGLNVMETATNDRMVLPAALYTLPTGDSTIFVVCERSTTTTDRRPIYGRNASTSVGYGLKTVSNTVQAICGSSFANAGTSTWGANQPAVLCNYKSGSEVSAGIDNSFGPPVSVTSATLANLFIGGTADADGLAGKLAEILVYSRALNLTERDEVHAYLQAKWGTP